MPKVIAVIPSYNHWRILSSCINSLLNQSLYLSKIIVVDNNSSDGTLEKIKSRFPQIETIHLNVNTGVTGGRNVGIRAAYKGTDYILFIDQDIIADNKMVEELLKVSEFEDRAGILTPKIYYSGDKIRIWSAGTAINLWTGQVIFRGGKDQGQYDQIEEVQVAPAVMLVKRQVIKLIKGFDNRYFATFEDTDFCFRCRKSGFKVIYAPRAIAFHKIPVDPKKEAERLLERSYWIGRNRILFMKDFGRIFFLFIFFIPVYILYYFKLAVENNKLSAFVSFLEGLLSGFKESKK